MNDVIQLCPLLGIPENDCTKFGTVDFTKGVADGFAKRLDELVMRRLIWTYHVVTDEVSIKNAYAPSCQQVSDRALAAGDSPCDCKLGLTVRTAHGLGVSS